MALCSYSVTDADAAVPDCVCSSLQQSTVSVLYRPQRDVEPQIFTPI